MSRHRISMDIEIDDVELATHVVVSDRVGGPYTSRVREWDASDVFHAADLGIIDPQECTLDYSGEVKPDAV